MKVQFFASRYASREDEKRFEIRDFALDIPQRTPCIEIDPEKMDFLDAARTLNSVYEGHPVLEKCHFFVILPDGSRMAACDFWKTEEE